MNEGPKSTARDPGSDGALVQIDNARQHEMNFIARYMALNSCSEAAARSVYIHVFANWPSPKGS